MLQRCYFGEPGEPLPPPFYLFPDRATGWSFLRYLLDAIFALFGTPARLGRLFGVSLQHRADINSWLCPAERLARILLLAEAADIVLPPLRKRTPRKAQRTGRFPRTDISKPNCEDWRVRFVTVRGGNRRGSGSKGYSIPAIGTFQLAMRYEALTRVALDPVPYARRLAARLRRRGECRTIVAAILREVPEYAPPLMRACNWALDLGGRARLVFNTG